MESLDHSISSEDDDHNCGNCGIKLEVEPPPEYANFLVKGPLYPDSGSPSISIGEALSTIFRATQMMAEELDSAILCYDCATILQQLYTIWQTFQVKSNPAAILSRVLTSVNGCLYGTEGETKSGDVIVQKRRLKARIARRPSKLRRSEFGSGELSEWKATESDHTLGKRLRNSTTTKRLIRSVDDDLNRTTSEKETAGIETEHFLPLMGVLEEDVETKHDPLDVTHNPNQSVLMLRKTELSNSMPADLPKRKRGRPRKGEQRFQDRIHQKPVLDGTRDEKLACDDDDKSRIEGDFESSVQLGNEQKPSTSRVTGHPKCKRGGSRKGAMRSVPASQVAAAELQGIFPDYPDDSESEIGEHEDEDLEEDEDEKFDSSKRHIFYQKLKIQRDKEQAARELASTGQISKLFVCKKCGRRFFSEQGLANHFNKVHLKIKGPFLCPIEGCDNKRNFKSRLALEGHLNMHKGLKPFICDQCARSFISKNRLDIHMVIHLKPEEKERLKLKVCHVCGAKFSKRHSLEIHMIVHAEDKPWNCSYEGCQQTFKYRQTLKRHVKVYHSNEKNSTPCSRCGREFNSKWNLHLHMKLHEKCDLSGAKMRKVGIRRRLKMRGVALATATSVENNGEPKKRKKMQKSDDPEKKIKRKGRGPSKKIGVKDPLRFCCTFENCERRFRCNTDLQTHMNRHLGLKPFGCDRCDWKGVSKHALDSHVKVHLEPEVRETFKKKVCEICGAKFVGDQARRRHMMVHVKDAPLQCPREGCEAKFKYEQTLRRHEREFHLGLMVVCYCHHCGRQFNRKTNLDAHLKVHAKNDLSAEKELNQ